MDVSVGARVEHGVDRAVRVESSDVIPRHGSGSAPTQLREKPTNKNFSVGLD
jgi:hypothetical protein